MSKILFYQSADLPAAIGAAGSGNPSFQFVGRILWVDQKDTDLLARLRQLGYEEIDNTDARYQLAVDKGSLHHHVLDAYL